MVVKSFFIKYLKGVIGALRILQWINSVLQPWICKALPIDRLQLFMQEIFKLNTQNPDCPFIVNKDAESAGFNTSSP